MIDSCIDAIPSIPLVVCLFVSIRMNVEGKKVLLLFLSLSILSMFLSSFYLMVGQCLNFRVVGIENSQKRHVH